MSVVVDNLRIAGTPVQPAFFRAKPSLGYAGFAIARNGGLYVAGLVSVPIASQQSIWLLPVAAAVLGLAMYRLTIVLHDCVHGTLFGSKTANRIAGVIAGACSGIEYRAFSRLHWLHHREVGQSLDPQGSDYLLPDTTSRAALCWHLVRPLVGYNVFKLGQVLAAHAHAEHRSWRDFAPVIAAQAVAALIASGGLRYYWLLPVPVLSAATFGLFFAQTRGFAEHAAMPRTCPEGFVRSHRTNLLDRLFLYDLNFNLHREHHSFPALPSCYLPELHRHMAARDPDAPPLATSMVATIWRRIAAAPPARTAQR